MYRILGTLALAALLAVLTVAGVGHLLAAATDQADARQAALLVYELEQQQLALDQQRAEVARQQAEAVALAPVVVAVKTGLLLLVPVGLLLAGLVLLDSYALRRRPLVRPDGRGLYPAPRALLDTRTGQRLLVTGSAAYHRAALAAAATPAPPHTYSPHITVRDVPRAAEVLAPEAAPLLQAAPPTFAQLLAAGQIGPGQPLLLAYADGQPLTGGWRDLYSSAVAGLSATGKTTTIRFLAAQSALHGARFLLLDPHADAGDESLAGSLAPLAGAFLAAPASDDRAMLRALALADNEMQRRLRGAPITAPWIVAVDEFTRLMGRGTVAAPLARLLEAIAQEGRKVGVFALISGQAWTVDRAGGSALRDTLASAYCHRMKRTQARLLVDTESARLCERLMPGQVLLARAGGGDVVAAVIPDTRAGDMAAVAQLLAGGSCAPSPRPRTAVAVVVPPYAPSDAPATARDPSPTVPDAPRAGQVYSDEEARVLQLFQSGQDVPAIVKALWGVSGRNPAQYQPRAAFVQATLRRALG